MAMSFPAAGFTCLYLCLFAAILRLGWAEDVSHNSETTVLNIRLRRLSPSVGSSPCLVPPHPVNGRWKLHRLLCDGDLDCDIPQGIMLQIGSQLVYSCADGYIIEGDADVFCRAKGSWSAIPSCIEIKCGALNSVSTIAYCSRFGKIGRVGAYGRVACFGRTAKSSSSSVLQTITVPYVSYNECKKSNKADQNEYLISDDQFCAGYTNGSAVCDGDSGGGLVFKKNDQWYVLGIVSVGLGVNFNAGERTCDKYSYTLYTKVSTYMDWIEDVISNPDLYAHRSRFQTLHHAAVGRN